jgi:hypothetical protein
MTCVSGPDLRRGLLGTKHTNGRETVWRSLDRVVWLKGYVVEEQGI